MSEVDIPRTYGSLLLGGLMAFCLSGAVAVQAVIYFKLYPEDKPLRKVMVSAVWLLDIMHSCFIGASLVDFFVSFFGDKVRIDHIPWSIAVSVVTTAAQTLIAHCFFAQKIHKASQRNWFITIPIILLASGRLLAASVSTFEMIRLKKFSAFTHHYPGWVFTTGLSLSAGVDIIITVSLCYFLRKLRQRLADSPKSIMVHVVDTMTLYTLENGLLTCLAATSSLICWLTMPTNLVFLGLHFVIGKLYANSLLASLNTRKELRDGMGGQHMQPWLRNDPQNPILTGEDFYPTARYRDPMTSLMSHAGMGTTAYRIPRVRVKTDASTLHGVERNSFDSADYPRNPRDTPIRRTPTVLQWTPRLP